MVKTEIAPAVESYTAELAKTMSLKQSVGEAIPVSYEKALLVKLSGLIECMSMKTDELEKALSSVSEINSVAEESMAVKNELLVKMSQLRAVCDEAETLTARKYWPFPRYGELLSILCKAKKLALPPKQILRGILMAWGN